MKLSLATSGLLDARRLDSWVPEKRQAIRRSVEAGMKTAGREIAGSVKAKMQSAFAVRKSQFLRSMRSKVLAANLQKLPALLIGSRIGWLGIHVHGGKINGRMLIPLLPEHQRLGRKAFRKIVDGLMHLGNAFFIRKGSKVILMAEAIKENQTELRRFKRAHRERTGAKSVKRGTEIPIAVLVPGVTLRARLDLAGIVRAQLPQLANRIEEQLSSHGL